MKKLITFFAGIIILLWFIATAPFAQAVSFLISLKQVSRERIAERVVSPLTSYRI